MRDRFATPRAMRRYSPFVGLSGHTLKRDRVMLCVSVYFNIPPAVKTVRPHPGPSPRYRMALLAGASRPPGGGSARTAAS